MLILKTTKAVGLSASAIAFSMFAMASMQAVQAHPHDLLGMCQVPSGKHIACEDTWHDTISDQHVPIPRVDVPGRVKNLTTQPPKQRKFKIQK